MVNGTKRNPLLTHSPRPSKGFARPVRIWSFGILPFSIKAMHMALTHATVGQYHEGQSAFFFPLFSFLSCVWQYRINCRMRSYPSSVKRGGGANCRGMSQARHLRGFKSHRPLMCLRENIRGIKPGVCKFGVPEIEQRQSANAIMSVFCIHRTTSSFR